MTTTPSTLTPTTQQSTTLSWSVREPHPATRRAGVALSGAMLLFLLFDAVVHIVRIKPVVDSFAALGYPVSVAVGIGILELGCLTLYVIPRTSLLGALLLTGYLGGAVSAQLRIDAPLFSTLLFPVYVGVALWAGLYLRKPALRSLVASR